jgi:hypothetical protein
LGSEDWRKLCNEELLNLSSSPNTVFTHMCDRNIFLIHYLKKGGCFTVTHKVNMFCVYNFLKINMVKGGHVVFGVGLCLGKYSIIGVIT